MMKVNELRIGNFVLNRHNEIDQITYNSFSKFFHPTMEGNPSGYEPIALTEEWLLKFGFYKRGQWYKKEGCHILGWVWNGVYIGMNRDYSINYMFVHELQNLYFALTGKELELKNK